MFFIAKSEKSLKSAKIFITLWWRIFFLPNIHYPLLFPLYLNSYIFKKDIYITDNIENKILDIFRFDFGIKKIT